MWSMRSRPGIYKGIEKVERIRSSRTISRLSMGTEAICICRPHVWKASRNTRERRPRNLSSTSWGGTEWNKTKTRVRGAVQEIARDLVKLYAARQEKAGFQYGTDTVWQRSLRTVPLR